MTALLSYLQAGLCHAKNFCRQLYPSYTTVFITANDLRNAKTENLARETLPDGLFSVVRTPNSERSQGTLESGALKAAFPFDRVILSINAFLPPKSWFLAEVQVGNPDKSGKLVWSKWYKLGKFTPDGASASFGTQEDRVAKVNTDVLEMKTKALYCRFRVTMDSPSIITPVLRLAAINFSDSQASYSEASALKPLAEAFPQKPDWLNPNRVLKVPTRSQRTEKGLDADSICSPVSLGMTMDYFGMPLSNAQIAGQVYDTAADIFGNWFFNTAFAGSKGLYSFVEKFNSIAEAERAVALGYPITASITYGKGELKNAPVDETKGHLVVIRGFDSNGNIRVNDPAAKTARSVPRWYLRSQFAQAWLKNKRGLAYRVEKRFPRVMRISAPIAKLYSSLPEAGKPLPELESQFFLNEAVLVKSFKNGWAEVVSLEQGFYNGNPCDGDIDSCWQGYPGWISADAITWGSAYGYAYTVGVPVTKAIAEENGKEKKIELYMGTRLCPVPGAESRKGYITAVLPGLAAMQVKAEDLVPAGDFTPAEIREGVVKLASQFEDTPYLWGGRTITGIDCSGLVGLVYRVFGVNLPRNADAQFRASDNMLSLYMQPGDLVFVSVKDNPDKIEHVLLYLGGEKLIEACRIKKGVAETTFKKRFGKKLEKLKQGENIDGHFVYFRKVIKDS